MRDPASLAAQLGGMLEAGDVAAVLVSFAAASSSEVQSALDLLRPVVQSRGAALLLQDLPELAVRAGADGAHLGGVEALKRAVPLLKPAHIAGAGGLSTRHDAMLAGEAGADYVMFGEPDIHGRRPDFAAVVDRVAWWAEIFEIPCAAFAASLEEVAALASAGAEFVVARELCFDAPENGPAVVRAAAVEAGGVAQP